MSGRVLVLVALSFASPLAVATASGQESDYERSSRENQSRNQEAIQDIEKAALERDQKAALERDEKAALERDQKERDEEAALERDEKAALAGDQRARLAHGVGSKWRYANTTDKMRGTSSRLASLKSKNALSFAFPYKGGYATLMLRNRPEDGLNVMLSIEGQFLCRSYSDDTVAVKFDNGAIQTFPCSNPDDGTTGVIFIGDERRFETLLRAATALTIEARFYQQGKVQIEFDVTGYMRSESAR